MKFRNSVYTVVMFSQRSCKVIRLLLTLLLLCGCASTPSTEQLDQEIASLQHKRAAAIKVEFLLKDLVTQTEPLDLPLDKSTLHQWWTALKEHTSSLSDLIREKERERSKIIHREMMKGE